MTTENNRQSGMSFDFAAIMTGSALLAFYCLVMIFAPKDAHAESAPINTAEESLEIRNDSLSTKNIYNRNWIQEGKPVPAEVLYNEQTPAPPHSEKVQSWHNKMLFPSVLCPYCGRRVPTKSGSYIWLLIGFVGQLAFTGRFLVQWLASEKARDSVIPTAFWWLSIFGSIFLLAYAVSILAWPIILGQTPNIFIYSRNIYFIRKREKMEEA